LENPDSNLEPHKVDNQTKGYEYPSHKVTG